MGIRQITPQNEIDAYLDNEISRLERVVINVFNRVGILAVSEARNNGSYLDQTGNLRSSIGYVILRDGQVLNNPSFKEVKGGTKGRSSGNSLIKSLTSKYRSGLVLIVVAGMEYAAYVETKRNVLASSEILAEQTLASLLKQLGIKGR